MNSRPPADSMREGQHRSSLPWGQGVPPSLWRKGWAICSSEHGERFKDLPSPLS